MKELVNAYKIVQYGTKIGMQFGMALLFLALGIVLEFLTRGTQSVGSFYIVLSGMFLYQMIVSSDISTLVQSSPYKKKIQCTYPLLAVIPWIVVTLAIVCGLHCYFAATSGPDGYIEQGQQLIILGLCIFILMVYFGIAYKYFITATVVMIIFVMAVMFVVTGAYSNEYFVAPSLGFCVAFAWIAAVLGFVCCKVLTNLLYKKDLSKLAFRGMTRK